MTEQGGGCSCHCGEFEEIKDLISDELKKDFRAAVFKKKEKILEAKLDFIRELNNLIKKSSEK